MIFLMAMMAPFRLWFWFLSLSWQGHRTNATCASPGWRWLKPSGLNPSTLPPFGTNEEHVVIPSRHALTHVRSLRVHLPGTFDRPSFNTCLLRSMAAAGAPTIGLSYASFTKNDASRNALCAQAHLHNNTAFYDCLAHQHEDALFGGNREHDLWPSVAEADSIVGRLVLLLTSLDKAFPLEGWGDFLQKDRRTPYWERIIVSGHSQGAGHAAFLAQATKLAGVVLLSGPQDDCNGCPRGSSSFWLDQPWSTKRVAGMQHGNESAALTIRNNWERMSIFVWPGWTTRVLFDIGFGMKLEAPFVAPLVSWILPSSVDACGGDGYHCSIAVDMATPIAAEKVDGTLVALYELSLWPALFDQVSATLTLPSENPSSLFLA